MKILLAFSNFTNNNQSYFTEVLNEYNNMGYDIDVVIDTTEEVAGLDKFRKLKIFQQYYHKRIGHFLTFTHRAHFANSKSEYDLFIYSENDMLITKNNLECMLHYEHQLPDYMFTGFLRYEKAQNDNRLFLPELHPFSPTIKDKKLVINGGSYFTVHNLHQGCSILTKEKLASVMKSPNFMSVPLDVLKYGEITYGTLERGASEVYINCGMGEKVIPHEDLNNLVIHHLPDKYVDLFREKDQGDPLTIDEVLKIINE